ncbi:MAG: hypothetical protein U1D30_02470 [Planctomycetota bacterium]
MLFKKTMYPRIESGEVTVAYRRWRRPSVKPGGTLLTPIGKLSILSVEEVDAEQLTTSDARKAGSPSLAALIEELSQQSSGTVYCIRFTLAGPDPRIQLRSQHKLSQTEIDDLRTRLERLDSRAPNGPWTLRILRLISDHPQRSAAELAAGGGDEKEWLKLNVRKLKNLGLTESLNPGYRLSPRGEAFLTSFE